MEEREVLPQPGVEPDTEEASSRRTVHMVECLVWLCLPQAWLSLTDARPPLVATSGIEPVWCPAPWIGAVPD